jgi:hypothetical protein
VQAFGSANGSGTPYDFACLGSSFITVVSARRTTADCERVIITNVSCSDGSVVGDRSDGDARLGSNGLGFTDVQVLRGSTSGIAPGIALLEFRREVGDDVTGGISCPAATRLCYLFALAEHLRCFSYAALLMS